MNLVEKDLKYIWHPCSQMKDYEELKPIVIERGEGAYLIDIEGKKYMDAVSSWWCNLFGHANEDINKAIKNQIEKLEHVIMANFSNLPAIELAERLVNITSEGLNKVFFCDNGSSAVEAAMKMSFHYHQHLGEKKKTKFVTLENAYHGETIGALSVGDLDLYNSIYKPLMFDVFRVTSPDCYRCSYGKCREDCNAPCFEHMEENLSKHHEEITAVIVEPLLQGVAGMKMYSPIYLKKLREACDRYNVNLIADEIATGFGRTGKMFACNHANISPDFMCISKGLTGGYLPMAIVMTRDNIYNAFYDDYNKMKAFLHSHTYSGNALGCAVACEVLNIFERDKVLEKNIEKAKMLNNKLKQELENHRNVGEIRTLGLINAIELVEDKPSKKTFDSKRRIGYEIYKEALEKGLLLRPLGNVLYFNPPYIIEERDMDFMVDICSQCIREVLG